MQWIVPKLSEQQFVIEATITVINVQSYPLVGGNWTVRFTTTGTADLIITAINGTTFGDSLPADLKFLELNDGNQTLTPEISGNSIIYRGYSSTAEGFERSLVLTSGEHHLEFRFGNSIAYANNTAGMGGTVGVSTCSSIFGGTWDGVNTCTITGSITVNSGETLAVPSGVNLVIANTSGNGTSNSGTDCHGSG